MKAVGNNIFITLLIGFAFLGALLVTFIESEILASEVVISIAFLVNIFAIYNKALSKIKNVIRYFSASFLFGALLGVIIV